MPEEKVKAVCIQRTAEAKADVEHEIQEMRHEREQQIAATNKNVSDLNTALAILTKDVTDLVGDEKSQRERLDNQDKLITQGAKQMDLILEWQKSELARHTREEIEKKEAIAKVEAERSSTAKTLEQERKDRIKPWQNILWGVVKAAAIFALGIIASAVWKQYFVK